jgi:iron complex transport system substrate-binding protein
VRRRALLVLIAASALTACGRSEPRVDPDARSVPDALGVAVRLPKTVRRIVTTVPGLTQTVIALDGPSRIVGVSNQDGAAEVPPSAERLPVWPAIPAEQVAALEPDLLLVDSTLSNQDLPVLRRRFPTTFACDSTSLDGLATTFARLGVALDRSKEAERLDLELRDARASAKVAGRPRVLLLTWADPPMALGPGSLLDGMLRSVGAENVAFDLPGPSRAISSEIVRERAPEWILLTGGTFPTALRTSWSAVPAVRDGRIVDASADEFVQAGPRTAAALRRLADILSKSPEGPR